MKKITYFKIYIGEVTPISNIITEFSNEEKLEDNIILWSDIIGYENISISNLSPFEMLTHLLNEFKNTYNPFDVDTIIFAVEEPSDIAKKIIASFFRPDVKVFFVSGNNCVNIQYAIDIACNGNMGNTLILTYTKFNSLKDRVIDNYALRGDSGLIIYLSDKSNNHQINHIHSVYNTHSIYTEGKNSSNAMINLQYYIKTLEEIIKIYGVNFQRVFLHHSNPLLFIEAINHLDINENLVYYDNFNKYGHLDGIDYFVDFDSILKEYKNERILCINTGYYGSYSASLYEI